MMSSKSARFFMKGLSLICFTMFGLSAVAQLRLSGAVSVTPGTGYTYKVAGEKTEKLPVNVCISGGVFAGTGETCRKGVAEEFTVVWQEGSERASLTVWSAHGDTTLYISKNTDLAGGEISGLKKRQIQITNKEELNLLCSPAKGGAVNGQYSYQWQSSDNCVVWKNITGAKDENLRAFPRPVQTTFYRRTAIEKISNTVMYSDVVTVFIVPAEFRPVDY